MKNRISGKEAVKINHLNNKIENAFKKKEWDSTIAFSREIIAIGSKNKDTACMVNGYFKLAYYQKKAYLLPDALKNYMSGINLATKSADSLKGSQMLLNLSNLQSQLGDYNGAQLSATQGLKLIVAAEQPDLAQKLYMNLGNSFQDLLDYKNAISCYKKALKFADTPNEKAGLQNNIGNCHRKNQQWEKAVKTYRWALKDSLQLKASSLARITDNYGVALSHSDPQAGKLILAQGLRLRQANNDKLGISTSLLHLAQWHLEHDPSKAQSYAERAVALSKETKAVDVEMEALEILVAVKKKPKQEAIRWAYIKDSISTATKKSFHQAVGIRFRTDEMERENLLLEKEKTAQKLLAEKERTQKWTTVGILAVSLVALCIFFFVYRKNKKQKREIEKQKDMVEKLQRELHHRLKNNLSFIDFFITLAKEKFPDPAYREKLNELQNRINSMFEVHRQLFKKKDVTHVNARTYISALTANVKKVYDRPNITLSQDIADTDLRVDTSFPIGLIVNEFVTNSYKYAFPNGEKGTIFIYLAADNNQYLLQLRDNGTGLPKDFDIDSLNSFGMETIKLLTQEYKGTFKLNGQDGTRMEITFPKDAR